MAKRKKPDPRGTYSDAEFGRDRARVWRFVDKWSKPMGLRWWHVDVECSRAPIDEGTALDGSKYKWTTDARCWVKWEYLRATVEFDLTAVADMDDETLEKKVVHEFCHILVAEMRERPDKDFKHEERVVAALTNAFLWVREAGEDDGAKKAKVKPKPKKRGRKGV